MRAAAWLVLAACAAGVAAAAGAGGARRVRRANDDDDEFNLKPTRNRPCKTNTGLEGICIDESMCDEAPGFLLDGVIDDSETRPIRCPGVLEWCCSFLNSNVTAIVTSTEGSERAKPTVYT